MKYGCYKTFVPTGGRDASGLNNGNWSVEKKINVIVDFSVGKHKDIVITNKGVKALYVVSGEPFEGKLGSGMRYQLIVAKKGGKKYVFQYLENYNLRLMEVGKDDMVEYGCSASVNKDKE